MILHKGVFGFSNVVYRSVVTNTLDNSCPQVKGWGDTPYFGSDWTGNMSFDYLYTICRIGFCQPKIKQKYTTNFRIQTVVISVRHGSRRDILLVLHIFNVVN
jgi:hypothetical protein